jgi:hypothetical protein
MRKVLTALIVLVLLVPSIDARRAKERAGKVKDGVYADMKYGFELSMMDGWKYSVKDNKNNFRLVLNQVNYETPSQYMSTPDYTRIPTTVVYADTTSMSAMEFIDSLVSDSYKSKQKNLIYKEFEIINEQSSSGGLTRQDLLQTGRKVMDIAGEKGVLWSAKAKYRNEINTGKLVYNAAQKARVEETKRVYGGLSGCIAGVKNGNTIILIHTICEEDYYNDILGATMELINSLKWASGESAETD